MPKPRSKPVKDLTTDEAVRKLFPQPIVREAKKEAQKGEEQKPKKP